MPDTLQVDIHPYDNQKFRFNHFDCGNKPLNQFIKNNNGVKKTSRRYEKKVFVAIHPGSTNCIGYFALELNSDTIPSAPIKVIKGLGYLAGVKATFARPKDRTTVLNSVHLGHLAVHNDHQNQGYGRYMMQDIFEKIAVIS